MRKCVSADFEHHWHAASAAAHRMRTLISLALPTKLIEPRAIIYIVVGR